jgi:IS30 family transposase
LHTDLLLFMASYGLSQRKAAKLLGVDEGTIRNDLRKSSAVNAESFRAKKAESIRQKNAKLAEARNADFVVIQAHLSLVFDRTQNNRALHVNAAAGAGRSSEISRPVPASKSSSASGSLSLRASR